MENILRIWKNNYFTITWIKFSIIILKTKKKIKILNVKFFINNFKIQRFKNKY